MRGFFRILIAGAAAAAIAGCSDSATSPSEAASRSLTPADRPSLDYNGIRFPGYRTTSFTLTSRGGTYDIGDGFYTLSVPANAVCVQGSSYGPGTWDSPCTTLKSNQSITVTATYGFSNGGPVVDFSPELRFSPSAQVTLSTTSWAPVLTSLASYITANPSVIRFFGMYYVTSVAGKTITDASTDKSLITHINLKTGLVYRRVKHFSGYNVTSGLACELSFTDPTCIDIGGPVIDKP